MRSPLKTELDRRDAEARAQYVAADRGVKAADVQLRAARAEYARALAAVTGIQAERADIRKAAAAEQRAIEHAERVKVARLESLIPFDARIQALERERAEVETAGNHAGVAALKLEIGKVKIRRHALATA